MGKKINEVAALTDSQVDDGTKLWALGVASNGQLSSATTTQIKKVMSTQKVKYVATGTEGTTLTVPEVAGKYILSIFREGSILYEVASAPDSAEYTFDSTNISLGLAVNPGERFLIHFKNA